MVEVSSPVCKACGRMMNSVADIAPLAREPGLRAFICDGCGASHSVLVYPPKPSIERREK
jgi:hypothetical protein